LLLFKFLPFVAFYFETQNIAPNCAVRKTNDQDRESQGFIHLQMGTNRFANQSGMTGFGMPRREVTKYKVGIKINK
jgi:hypothetical protein